MKLASSFKKLFDFMNEHSDRKFTEDDVLQTDTYYEKFEKTRYWIVNGKDFSCILTEDKGNKVEYIEIFVDDVKSKYEVKDFMYSSDDKQDDIDMIAKMVEQMHKNK